MKTAFVMLFLVGTQLCLGQNLFDGTWLNKLGEQVPQGTVSYSLDKDTFRCSCAVSNIEIKPDGEDHKVPETPYWGTLNVQAVDTHTVVILAKKSGRITYTEIDSVTDDMLTQVVKDTTELETVTLEIQSHRLENGPKGYHPISGSWRPFKATRSRNGSLITFQCTKDAFTAETPIGEKYTAKFDGNFYPVEDDPGHTVVSARLLDPRNVELTSKRNGQIVSISRLSVTSDGKLIHVIFENKEAGSTITFDYEKQ